MLFEILKTRHPSGASRFVMDYDACGNMVYQEDNQEGVKKQLHYDAFNRISEVRDPDSGRLIGEYHYDDGGFRVRKLARRMMEGEEKLVEVLYPSMYFGVETQRTCEGQEIPDTSYAVNNIYVNGVRVAAVIPSGAARYYHTDQVDSVKVVTDDAGMPVSRFEYLPYGETWVEETADDVDEEHNPKYNSQELDRETNFYYYNARHYDPVICRFVTADTVVDGEGSAFGWNRYMYTHGNPVMYRDPTGHEVKIKQHNQELTSMESFAAGLLAATRAEKNNTDTLTEMRKMFIEKNKSTDGKMSLIRKKSLVIANDVIVGHIVKGYKIRGVLDEKTGKIKCVYDYDVLLSKDSNFGEKGEKVKLSSVINKEQKLDEAREKEAYKKHVWTLLGNKFTIAEWTGNVETIKSVAKKKTIGEKVLDLLIGSNPITAYQDADQKAAEYRYKAKYGMKAFTDNPIKAYGFDYETIIEGTSKVMQRDDKRYLKENE